MPRCPLWVDAVEKGSWTTVTNTDRGLFVRVLPKHFTGPSADARARHGVRHVASQNSTLFETAWTRTQFENNQRKSKGWLSKLSEFAVSRLGLFVAAKLGDPFQSSQWGVTEKMTFESNSARRPLLR